LGPVRLGSPLFSALMAAISSSGNSKSKISKFSVETERIERAVQCPPRIVRPMARVAEPAGDVHLGPIDAEAANPLPDSLLVAVLRRGVNVPIADLECSK
jgi:hypothetical protein